MVGGMFVVVNVVSNECDGPTSCLVQPIGVYCCEQGMNIDIHCVVTLFKAKLISR